MSWRTLLLCAASMLGGAPAHGQDGPPLLRARLAGDRVRLEVAREALGADYLVTARVTKSAWRGPGPSPADELGTRVARWEQSGGRLLLRDVSQALAADTASPVQQAVAAASYGAILAAFPIDSTRPDGTLLVDATRLFASRVVEFAAIRGQLDAARTFVEHVATFPINVEVDAVHTATVAAPATAAGTAPSGETTISYGVHWSIVRLPEQPMVARAFDPRVGFHAVQRLDFGGGSVVRPVSRAVVQRYRLERRSGDRRPARPITFIIDPATPRLWVPWIKKGVEEWQPAFAAAGFDRAIVAADPPAGDSASWSPDDARYSVVRWLPSAIESADLSAIVDPRSGEVLSAQIKVFHNVLHQLRNWYVVQAGAVDPRARRLPLPDSLLGRLLQGVVAHEVGHALGLQHDFAASALYPLDSLRSRRWNRAMGYSPSLMDYARTNYVAQPGDSVQLADLVPRVGPYDAFAISWGYGERAPAASSRAESRWLPEQDRMPWLRFLGSARNASDPLVLTESVGDADAVRATALGFENLARVLAMLRTATPSDGWDDATVADIYGALGKQWETELLHVVSLVGGLDRSDAVGGPFAPVARARQRAAVAFVLGALVPFPAYVADSVLSRRIEPTGASARMWASQRRILSAVLDSARLSRLLEAELLGGPAERYTAHDLLDDVGDGVWAELATPDRPIAMHRRSLQRAYVEVVGRWLARDGGADGDGAREASCAATGICALAHDALARLYVRLGSAVARAQDPGSRAHLVDARRRLQGILGPVLATDLP